MHFDNCIMSCIHVTVSVTQNRFPALCAPSTHPSSPPAAPGNHRHFYCLYQRHRDIFTVSDSAFLFPTQYIPLPGCTTVYLSIHMLKVIFVASFFHLCVAIDLCANFCVSLSCHVLTTSREYPRHAVPACQDCFVSCWHWKRAAALH